MSNDRGPTNADPPTPAQQQEVAEILQMLSQVLILNPEKSPILDTTEKTK